MLPFFIIWSLVRLAAIVGTIAAIWALSAEMPLAAALLGLFVFVPVGWVGIVAAYSLITDEYWHTIKLGSRAGSLLEWIERAQLEQKQLSTGAATPTPIPPTRTRPAADPKKRRRRPPPVQTPVTPSAPAHISNQPAPVPAPVMSQPPAPAPITKPPIPAVQVPAQPPAAVQVTNRGWGIKAGGESLQASGTTSSVPSATTKRVANVSPSAAGTTQLGSGEYLGGAVDRDVVLEGLGPEQLATVIGDEGPALDLVQGTVGLRHLLLKAGACGIALRRSSGAKLSVHHVVVCGNVEGIPGEDGTWDIPGLVGLPDLHGTQARAVPQPEHDQVFMLLIQTPVACQAISQTYGVHASISTLTRSTTTAAQDPTIRALTLTVTPSQVGTVLHGHVDLVSPYFIRQISISGRYVESAATTDQALVIWMCTTERQLAKHGRFASFIGNDVPEPRAPIPFQEWINAPHRHQAAAAPKPDAFTMPSPLLRSIAQVLSADAFGLKKLGSYEYLGGAIDRDVVLEGQGPHQVATVVGGDGPALDLVRGTVGLRHLLLEAGSCGIALRRAPGVALSVHQVIVRGKVEGIAGEEEPWDIPTACDLPPMLGEPSATGPTANPGQEFVLLIQTPVPCQARSRIESVQVSMVAIEPTIYALSLLVAPGRAGSMLHGYVELISPSFIRQISIAGRLVGGVPPPGKALVVWMCAAERSPAYQGRFGSATDPVPLEPIPYDEVVP